MSIVSDVEIRLRADIARLRQDMQNARNAVGAALNGIGAAADSLKGVIGGVVAGLSVGAFASFIKNSIDAADALNDMSARTKVAIEDLAGLSFAAKMGDTSLEGVAGAISKLGTNIGKDAAKFRELGVTATEPLEAFKQLADIFKTIEDPQQRAAFGAEALGKSWQEAAVLLDAGSEGIGELIDRGKELSGITEQVAADAGAFNDKIDELGFAAQGVGTRIAAGLLPTLQKIADSFSADAANSKELAGAIDVLAVSLKVLYSVGIGVSSLFMALGKTIGGTMAIVAKVMSSDIRDTVAMAKDVGNIYTEMFADVYGGLGDAATRIQDLWTDTGKAVEDTAEKTATATGKSAAKVAAFLNSGDIKSARDKSAADAAAAAKKEEAAYTGLITSIKEKMAADQMEIDGAAAITPIQQARIKLDQELATGKLELTERHREEAYALLDTAEALERNAEAAKRLRAREAEAFGDVASAKAQTQALRDQITYYGLTEDAVLKLHAAEIQRGIDNGHIDDLERERLQGLLDATNEQIALQGELSKMKSESTFWLGLEDTARQTFISIANGSKDTATRLKDTFKNVFFDWLYQMTVKKWIINVQGQLSATGAATGGLVGAATSALSGGGVAGSIGSLAGIAGVLGSVGGIATGALQTAGALLTGQIAVGQTLSAGLAALTSGSAAGAVAGLSSLAGTLGPIALGIAGGVALLKKAFGSGPKEVTGTRLEGMITPTGATGSTLSDWTKKGGWFSSSKRGTDSTAFTQAQVEAFTETYSAILDVSKMMGDAVGANTDALATRVQALKVNLTGLKTEAEQLGAVTKFFEGVADTVAAELVPNLSNFQREGESLSATLSRVAQDYATVDAAFSAIGKSFGAVGVASIDARERLLAYAGGTEAFASQISYFQQNMLTEAQRLAPVQKVVTEQLAAMGQSSLKTNEQFAAAALAIDTTTDAGAKLFAQMLELAPSFKLVADARAAEAKAAEEAAAVIAQARADALAAEIAAREEAAAALAAANKTYQDQINQILAAREGEAAVRALEIEGMAASTVALYDRVKALQAEDAAAEAAAKARQAEAEAAAAAVAKAAEALANANKPYQDQIDQIIAARQGEAAVRALEIRGMDASTVALYDHLAALNAETKAQQAAAEALAQNEQTLRDAVGAALDGVRDSIAARKDEVKTAFDAVMAGLSASIDQWADKISDLKSLSGLLNGARVGAVQSGASRAAAQSQLEAALATAASTGVLPSADSLRDAIAAVSATSTDQFGTLIEYQRDQARATRNISGLAALTDDQLTTAERTLRTLQDQKAAAEASYAIQIASLDSLVTVAQRNAEIALGTYQATLDTNSAIATLAAAVEALKTGATTSNPTGAGLTVEGLYQAVLGRAADATGLAFWQNAFGATVDAAEYAQFIASAADELKAKAEGNWSQWLASKGVSSPAPTSASTMQTALDTLNTQMTNMQSAMARTASATTKLAEQFDQVSGGGNALLTETP